MGDGLPELFFDESSAVTRFEGIPFGTNFWSQKKKNATLGFSFLEV